MQVFIFLVNYFLAWSPALGFNTRQFRINYNFPVLYTIWHPKVSPLCRLLVRQHPSNASREGPRTSSILSSRPNMTRGTAKGWISIPVSTSRRRMTSSHGGSLFLSASRSLSSPVSVFGSTSSSVPKEAIENHFLVWC